MRVSIGLIAILFVATPALADWTTTITKPECIGEPSIQLVPNPSESQVRAAIEDLRTCDLYTVQWTVTNSIELDPCDNNTECSQWADEKCTDLCCADSTCSQGGSATVYSLDFTADEECDSSCRCGDGSEQEVNAICSAAE